MRGSIFSFALSFGLSSAVISRQKSPRCNYLPGDPEWPSDQQWAGLNSSVSGRLIKNKPLPQVPCHELGFNSSGCIELRNNWLDGTTHFDSAVSVMSPVFQNNSCTPYADVNPDSCVLGNLASYSINVSNADDVIAGIKFAKENNVRLVVKNTGHDWIGRSTGQGALSLWMHNLQEASLVENYKASNWDDAALRLGAGLQGSAVSDAANRYGKAAITGYCPTVGAVGGYYQTAGFGPLVSAYGMGADNVLELEIVTPQGEYTIVNETSNPDLFWALRGGGGGTFGVVLSVLTKAHNDVPVAGASLSVNNTNDDKFWNMFTRFQQEHEHLNKVANLTVAWRVLQTQFAVNFATWPGHTSDELTTVFKNFTSYLDQQDIKYNFTVSDDPGYYSHFSRWDPDLSVGGIFPTNEQIASRFIPPETVKSNATDITSLVRKQMNADQRFVFGGLALNVSKAHLGDALVDNAVMPGWRNASFYFYTEGIWDPESPISELDDLMHTLTYKFRPAFRELTPGGGAYMNEDTWDNPTWKEDFFGVNYDRLLKIKQTVDPDDILYSRPSVGHEFFEQTADGRICRI